jgi:hypothetical protein
VGHGRCGAGANVALGASAPPASGGGDEDAASVSTSPPEGVLPTRSCVDDDEQPATRSMAEAKRKKFIALGVHADTRVVASSALFLHF